jgi:hypothetical protein
VRSLRDPLAKMSKSDPIADARILLDDTPDVIRRKVSRSVTDARRDMTYDPEDRPGVANLLGILAALRSEIAAREGEPGTELYVFRRIWADKKCSFFRFLFHFSRSKNSQTNTKTAPPLRWPTNSIGITEVLRDLACSRHP